MILRSAGSESSGIAFTYHATACIPTTSTTATADSGTHEAGAMPNGTGSGTYTTIGGLIVATIMMMVVVMMVMRMVVVVTTTTTANDFLRSGFRTSRH